MKLLLDSHLLIWWVDQVERVGESARRAILADGSELYVSSGTVLELAIKVGIGRLTLSAPFRDWMELVVAHTGAILLPISIDHAAAQSELPRHHGDPFDRLLVAQAVVEGMTVISRDKQLDAYGIDRIW